MGAPELWFPKCSWLFVLKEKNWGDKEQLTEAMGELEGVQMQVRCVSVSVWTSNVQERQVGKKGGEENVGYEANEGEGSAIRTKEEEEEAQTGYGSIQVIWSPFSLQEWHSWNHTTRS